MEIQLQTAISFFCFLFAVHKLLPGLFPMLLQLSMKQPSPAQAHERDDLEEGGAVASLIKAASYLCCFDKT